MTPAPPLPVLLAHRGLWHPDRNAENTADAFRAACAAGFGVELDVWRDRTGRWVVSHDLPDPSRSYLPYRASLSLLRDLRCPMVAINVKEDGAEDELASVVQDWGLGGNAFFFDQQPESTVRLLQHPVLVLARASDRGEPLDVALAGPTWGVWLDTFEVDWVDARVVERVHTAGKTAWVVSPELHGRVLDLRWLEEWREADGVCTDFPGLCRAWYAREGPLFRDAA